MKIHRSADYFHIDLLPAEARVLLEELSHVRGGARLPKLRQVCVGLEALLTLIKPEKCEESGTKRKHRRKIRQEPDLSVPRAEQDALSVSLPPS